MATVILVCLKKLLNYFLGFVDTVKISKIN